MITLTLPVELHENQEKIHRSPALFKVIKSGKRFGKSIWAKFEFIKHGIENKNKTYWYIAPTYGQARDIAWLDIKELIPKELIENCWDSRLTVKLKTGCYLVLKGADNPDTLRGIAVDGYILDEYAYMDGEIWNRILKGQLREGGFAYFISSPKYEGGQHFIDLCEEAQRRSITDNRWAYFYFTIRDNPTLSKKWIDELEADMPQDVFNLEYMAIDSAMTGVIFKEFNYGLHCKEVPKDLPQVVSYRSIDWGIAHPTVCLWAYVSQGKFPVYIPKTFKRSDLVIEESAKVIQQMSEGDNIGVTVADPSLKKRNSQTKRTDFDEFQRCGIGAIAGDNNDRGYNIVKMFLKKNLIVIDPSNKDLIYELRHVQYGDKEGEDCLDALRYLLVYLHDIIFGKDYFDSESNKIEEVVDSNGLRVMSLYDKRIFKGRWKEKDNDWVMDEAV